MDIYDNSSPLPLLSHNREDRQGLSEGVVQRKNAEEQLQFQATILRHVSDSVIVTDLQGNIMYWNEGATAVFGYTAEEMIGKSGVRLYPDMDMAQLEHDNHFQRILAGEDYTGEWKGRRKDGTVVWIDAKTTVLRSLQGEAIGLIGVSKDITARKQAEDRLHQSEKLFRALIENSADAIALMDAQSVFRYASPSTRRVLGYDPEEIVGVNGIDSLVHPDDVERTRRNLGEILQQPGKSLACEFRVRHKDETWRWIEASGLNLLEEPDVAAVVANYSDITVRKQLEQEITKAKEQLEIILRNVADGIVVFDAKGRFVYVNDVVAGWFGFPSAAAMQTNRQEVSFQRPDTYATWDEWGRLLPPNERPAARALRGEKARALVQFEGSMGRVYWVLVTAQPIFDEQGQIQLVVCVYTDMTEQKEFEQRKDHFISMASHELKTPLTILSAFTQLLRERFEAEDRQDVMLHLAKMDGQINKLTRLVADLLDISKMQAGKLVFAQEEVDMNELVREVVENLQPTTAHHLYIEGTAQGTITGDRERLGQVLLNLLTNAIKYSPHAESVYIRLVQMQDVLTVSVQDFGIGIAQGHQRRIFERFYRVGGEKDSTYPGLGIGLYIAYEIVQRHGGKMWVESVEGKGSTFSFSLPIR